MTEQGDPPDARLDKWMWSVRIFKTRSLAMEACRSGAIEIGERECKASRTLHPGEKISLRQGIIVRTFQVLGFPLHRIGAKRVQEFCLELTPESEWTKAKEQRIQHLLSRPTGEGRPTKRERRLFASLFD